MANQRIIEFGFLQRMLTQAESRKALFEDKTFIDNLKGEIDEQIQVSEILSLDVFDTFLLRDNTSELFRFWEVAKNVSKIIDREPIECLMARYLATKASYRLGERVSGCREGSLTEIHSSVSNLLTGDIRYTEEFVQVELECEAKRLTPNTALIEVIEQSPVPVILLSDMYAHAEQIKDILILIGIDTEMFNDVISSADTQVSKNSGKIFRSVEKRLNKKPSNFLHIGDAFRGDYSQAKLNGWNAIHLPIPMSEINKRKKDHYETIEFLRNQHNFEIEINAPN